MQSLVCSLNCFCKGIRSIRAFIRRMYDSMCGCFKPHQRIRLSCGIRFRIVLMALKLHIYPVKITLILQQGPIYQLSVFSVKLTNLQTLQKKKTFRE